MEAILYEKLDHKLIRCCLCNHRCIIKPDHRGICGVRENKNGILYSLNYGISIASSIDPIEKKPLYEYMPNTRTYSFATVGCNMDCKWCQNYTISQSPKSNKDILGYRITPKKHIENAMKYQCPSISYTYSEPTIFFEYALETMQLAKKEGLKNIWVSNGYMTEEALQLIMPYLDACNIDYKGNDNVYKKYCTGSNKEILKNLKTLKDNHIHLEITTLLIPGVNNRDEQVKEIAEDLIKYLGKDFIWHITRFFPNYEMLDVQITKIENLERAKQIGNELGIKKIYLGNI
ncbi:AmmeMemoRadiSam system radical SAM enzyme [Candidatus Izemoplasma sp. B36]|uniref:AmmeMemoRadiSam system radical SAM enzyme n=1 Tax=Candidatus Izemoplasma sp. B36 TaxID=3242468 RepID=UPI0035562EE1